MAVHEVLFGWGEWLHIAGDIMLVIAAALEKKYGIGPKAKAPGNGQLQHLVRRFKKLLNSIREHTGVRPTGDERRYDDDTK